ncbi:SulP family inorganic anion transporter [Nocardia barduliensis]|uniref:SulP family inorganic anion transporter n=1 Tax=Nocardia barduliensis TaxID=2736643 RepID=UPI003F68B254
MSTDTDSAPRTSLHAGMAGRLTGIGRADLPASIVVFLVALTLSLGVAVVSGAPAAGLIAAVVGGVVPGLLGGSAIQVGAPTDSLTVVVAESVQQFGWAATSLITIGAGMLGIAAYHRGHAHVLRPHLDQAADAGFGVVDQLGMVDVAVQLETLYGHPAVRRAVEQRGVAVSGLFFDLATARVIEVMVDGIAELEDDGRRIAAEPV